MNREAGPVITAMTAAAAPTGASQRGTRGPGTRGRSACRPGTRGRVRAVGSRNGRICAGLARRARGGEVGAQLLFQIGHRSASCIMRPRAASPRAVVDRTVLGVIRKVAAIPATSRST